MYPLIKMRVRNWVEISNWSKTIYSCSYWLNKTQLLENFILVAVGLILNNRLTQNSNTTPADHLRNTDFQVLNKCSRKYFLNLKYKPLVQAATVFQKNFLKFSICFNAHRNGSKNTNNNNKIKKTQIHANFPIWKNYRQQSSLELSWINQFYIARVLWTGPCVALNHFGGM